MSTLEWGIRNIYDGKADIVEVLTHGSHMPLLTRVPTDLALQIVREHDMLLDLYGELKERFE